MRNVAEAVREMAADCAQGRTPTALRLFLEASFGDTVGGWLSAWFSRARTYEVTRIELFDDEGFFRHSCVFQVFVRDNFLEGAMLPLGGTFGLFALAKTGFHYLNHRPQELEHLLAAESRPLNECAPTALASLVVEALGRDRNNSHAVVKSAEHLARYEGDLKDFGGGYEINPREWERVRDSVVSPMISGDGTSGWLLEFCSLFGWMHHKQHLIRHRYHFDSDFRLTHDEQALTRKIFKRTPAVRY